MTDMNSYLQHHIVDRVDILYTRGRYPRLHGMNAIKGYHGFGGDVYLARIWTNQGAQGWGVLSESVEVAEKTKELLIGKPLNVLIDCDEGILSESLRAFDIPLHDLAARIVGIPVSKMINPNAVASCGIYDGAIYMNDLIPEDKPWGVERVMKDCEDDLMLGHRALKIKVGRGHMWMEPHAGMERDIEIVNRIHERWPEVTLMVDANDGYSVDDAITFLKGTKNVPIYWFEEPMREAETSFRPLKRFIRANCPGTRIADGENRTDIPLLFDLAGKGLLDVLQPDVCGYGFTPWRKLLKEMVKHGFAGSPHAWGHVVKTNCCAHLAVAYPQHIPYIEAVLGTTEGIDAAGYVLKDGMLHVPQTPGFGMELEFALEVGKTFP